MSDSVKVKIDGIHIVDTITNVKTGKVEVIERGNNLVVNKVLPLIMGILKGSLSGIQYWAVGSGSDTWDSSPVSPTLNEVKLTNELGRKAITSSNIKFVDPSTNEESGEPTNCLQIECTFYEEDCNGKWREFGIFGGNATTAINSGYLIDKKHHEIFTKTEENTVNRKIFLTISFS